jgi:hypothetical protein
VTRLERVEAPKDVQDGFLNQIAGVQRPTSGWGKTTVREARQARDRALKQGFYGLSVTFPCTHHQLDGGLVTEKRVIAFGRFDRGRYFLV